MASRSCEITVDNLTGAPLTLTSSDLPGGEWSQDGGQFPPELISPASDGGSGSVTFGSESDGFATGTNGSCVYSNSSNSDSVNISWDNPFSGGNTFSADTTGGLTATYGDTSGDNMNVTVSITATTS
jgi:hypothetical protein